MSARASTLSVWRQARLFYSLARLHCTPRVVAYHWFYASPLLLLAFCVIYGVGFMVWLIYNYEEHQHGNPHTRFAYALSLSLGFSSLACFCVGYLWLIIRVAG